MVSTIEGKKGSERLRAQLSRAEKRISILIGGRLRDMNSVKKAVEIQDELREKTKGVEWSGVEEIRKWRKRK